MPVIRQAAPAWPSSRVQARQAGNASSRPPPVLSVRRVLVSPPPLASPRSLYPRPCVIAGDWLRDWRRRFFELRGDTLAFSKGEGSEPHGTIDLKSCLTVKSAGDKCGRKHAFEVATAQRVFFMCADSEKDKDEWIGAIGRAIVRFAASTGVGDHDEDDDDEDDDEDDVYGSNAGGDL